MVMGPSLLVNCYLEIKFHKKIRVNPPPPLKSESFFNMTRASLIFLSLVVDARATIFMPIFGSVQPYDGLYSALPMVCQRKILRLGS